MKEKWILCILDFNTVFPEVHFLTSSFAASFNGPSFSVSMNSKSKTNCLFMSPKHMQSITIISHLKLIC